MKTIVQVKQVKKIYGSKGITHTALDSFDMNIAEGEFVGIMGPSGSGKTTLLNMLATIDQPTSGQITIDGTDVFSLDEDKLSEFRREKLGFIFQDYNLLDTLTVRENILLPLALAKVNPAELNSRVDAIADKFGIASILDKYPHHISGGQKQRTAASRAIIASPSLILADEPTGALDSKSSTDLLESFKSLHEQDRATILMVTHDAFAASYCQRVLFIKDGRMFTELARGNASRGQFYKKLLDVLVVFGGAVHDPV